MQQLKANNFKKKNILFITLLIIGSLLIASIPFFQSGFSPVYKDAMAAACALKNINQNNSLGWGENFYINYDVFNIPYCWGENVYPTSQIFFSLISFTTGLAPAVSIIISYLFIYILCILMVYLICWEIYKKPIYSFLAGILFALSPALLRSVTIYPHSLFGIMIALFIIWLIVKWEKDKRIVYITFSIILSGLLVLFHQLTLIVFIFTIPIYILLKTKKIFKFLLFIVIAVIILFAISFFLSSGNNSINYFIGFIYESTTAGMVNLLPAHPVWDHPAILGFALTIFGLLGAVISLFKKDFLIKKLLLPIMAFCLFMGYSYLIGFYFLGYRFIFLLIIPLCIFAPLSFDYISKLFNKKYRIIIFTPIFTLIIISSFLHATNFLQDNYTGQSSQVIPTDDIINAIEWLNNDSEADETLLTVMRNKQKYASFFPYYYNGNVMSYPAFGFEKLEEFTFRGNTFNYRYSDQILYPETFLGKIIKPLYIRNSDDKNNILNNIEKNKEKLHDMYMMINYPNNEGTIKIMDDYNLVYFLAWRGKPEGNIYYKANDFKKVYKNDILIIFKREL